MVHAHPRHLLHLLASPNRARAIVVGASLLLAWGFLEFQIFLRTTDTVDNFRSLSPWSGGGIDLSAKICQSWAERYGLTDDANPPPDPLNYQGPSFPAPHLQDCFGLTKERRKLEMYDERGNPPAWAVPALADGIKVPWVQGSDEDNLPLTHLTQRDYWLHQHPKDCKNESVRFVLVPWSEPVGHGLGSQLHVMTQALAVAYALGRILVPVPATFTRSDHDGCEGRNRGSFNCYFFPLTYEDCEDEAIRLLNDIGRDQAAIYADGRSFAELAGLSNQKGRVVFFYNPAVTDGLREMAEATTTWGDPWVHTARLTEVADACDECLLGTERVAWLRSQLTKYMLRFPSLRLCHLLNRERHLVYGKMVAEQVADAVKSQRFMDVPTDLLSLAGFQATASQTNNSLIGVSDHYSPFLFHPIISLHVRQGDKGIEMDMHPFSHFMFASERIRFHSPNAKYIWLSTEMQPVIDESRNYTGWIFMYSSIPRQSDNTRFADFERSVGLKKMVDTSFVNLVIASECDYFVGTLGSNWNRLINELRLTNGKLKSGYVALNNFNW